MKPLFRWTVGNVSWAGLQVLKESLVRTRNALGINRFDWLVTHNSLEAPLQRALDKICDPLGIERRQCSWAESALPHSIIAGATLAAPNGRQGSFWKLCPARLRPSVHEIVVDNDLILCNASKIIDQFLASDKTLVLEERVQCLGRYYRYFEADQRYSSGLYGLPPNFGFEKALLKTWQHYGAFLDLVSQDEQGLITRCLLDQPHLILPESQMTQLLSTGSIESASLKIIRQGKDQAQRVKNMYTQEYLFTDQEQVLHFCEVNRIDHAPWRDYLRHKKRRLFL